MAHPLNGMEVESRKLNEIKPYSRNPRKISDKAIDKVAASLQEFGFRQPLVVDEAGTIIVGHTRLLAAKKLGLDQIPVHTAHGLTDAQKRAYRLADNRTGEESKWDMDLLSLEIGDLDGFDVSLTGFDDAELVNLLRQENEGLTDPDAIPGLETEEVTKPGDIWKLGEHRLACGSSTDAETVKRLFGEQTADLLFTSPPYAQQRDYKAKISDWDDLMNGVFSAMKVKDGAQVLVNLGMVHNKGRVNAYWDQWLDFMDGMCWPLFGWYVWDQGHGMPGNWNGRLAPSHEFVFHFARKAGQANKWVDKKAENIAKKVPGAGAFRKQDGGLKPIYSGDACAQPTKIADSVIRVNRAPAETAKSGHPATYPVALCTHVYNSFAKAGDIVFEPFSGSGTSIIACEKFGAMCYAIELAPAYVDVAVRRWQEFSGENATLEGDGKTFQEVENGKEARN